MGGRHTAPSSRSAPRPHPRPRAEKAVGSRRQQHEEGKGFSTRSLGAQLPTGGLLGLLTLSFAPSGIREGARRKKQAWETRHRISIAPHRIL